MKKIRLRAINLPKGFISRWIEYEVEEIPEEQEEKCQCGLKECICAEPEETKIKCNLKTKGWRRADKII